MSDQPARRSPNHPSEPTGWPTAKPVGTQASAGDPGARRPPNRLVLRAAMLSDVGRARDHQEDAVAVHEPADPAILAQRGRLYMVADGMGGHNAGEVASQAAVAEVQRHYYGTAGEDIPNLLRQALQAANTAVYHLSQGDARRTGMGTTATVAIVRGSEVHIANVGDSRAYLLSGGAISQITEDHSWVEEQVRAGVLTPEQARVHPQRNVITRALGTGPRVQPDLFNGTLSEGETLLICSDGLTGHVSDPEILELAGQLPPQQAVQSLVDLANERGGSDNISVILVRPEYPSPAPAPATAPRTRTENSRRGRLPWLLIGLLAVALIAAGAVAASLLRGDSSQPQQTPVEVASSPAPSPIEPTATAVPASPSPGLLAGAQPTSETAPTATLASLDTPTSPPAASTTAGPASPPTATVSRATRPAGAGQASPLLLSPQDGIEAENDQEVRFAWTWAGTLGNNQAFEVRIWREGSVDHAGAAQPLAQASGTGWEQRIRVGSAPAVEAGGDGTYLWTVAVVSINPYRLLGPEALPRQIRYRRIQPAAATPTPRPPTSTPTVLPARPTNTPTTVLPTPTPTSLLPTDTPTLAPTKTPTPLVQLPTETPEPEPTNTEPPPP